MLRRCGTGVVTAFGNTVAVSRVNDPSAASAAAGEDVVRAAKAAALGELTRGAAHELNNPLLAILGLVDLLVRDAEEGSRAQQRLTVIRDTALEMRGVLRALLDFARDGGDSHEPVDLGDVVRRTVELVRRTASARDVELAERIPSGTLTVLGNSSQIGQAVLHLLANAYAALPAGGKVVVDVEADVAWATVTVTDSGEGVPVELAERVFEPFFTTRGDGSGLGLTASRAIAQSHGGSLELRTTGRGASFVLTLPLADEGTVG
jgi:signal transduction histidine kinase